MSSDSEMSNISESSTSLVEEDDIEDEEGGVEVVHSQITPYEDEPLAADDGEDRERADDGEEADVDGLTPAVLKARHEKEVAINSCLVL